MSQRDLEVRKHVKKVEGKGGSESQRKIII
jgi:hypothetical protein